MLNERSIVDRIERAQSDRPYCECGRHTVTGYRDGAVWLDCSIIEEPPTGRVVGLWNTLTARGHVHSLIVELWLPEQLAA
jgi:hypothetical protein